MNKKLMLIAMLFYFVSCSEKTEPAKDEQAQVKSVAETIDPKKQKLESLKSMEAIDLEELRNLLPKEINSIKRTNVNLSSSLGYGIARADYEKNSKTNYTVSFYDCSGKEGAKIFSSMYQENLGVEKRDSLFSISTIDLNGGKAIEKIEADTKIHTLTFLANDRILVVISGRNVEPETLKEASRNLNLKIS